MEKKEELARQFSEALKYQMQDKYIELGFDIAKLQNEYYYKDLLAFLKGDKTECYNYYELKPLYDKYGYELVNETILKMEVHNA